VGAGRGAILEQVKVVQAAIGSIDRAKLRLLRADLEVIATGGGFPKTPKEHSHAVCVMSMGPLRSRVTMRMGCRSCRTKR